ncbi:hypothetical protein ACA910_012599 [Epithemia clementina (nom. ined.)]
MKSSSPTTAASKQGDSSCPPSSIIYADPKRPFSAFRHSQKPHPVRKSRLAPVILPYLIASLLGCFSSIFIFICFSVPQLDAPGATSNSRIRDRDWRRPDSRFDRAALQRLPPQVQGHVRFGDQRVRSVTDKNNSHDDYFSEKLPDDGALESIRNDASGSGRSRGQLQAKLIEQWQDRRSIEQRRQERKSRRDAYDDKNHLEQISGSLLSTEDSYAGIRPNRKRADSSPTTLLGKLIHFGSELMSGMFGDQDEQFVHRDKSLRDIHRGVEPTIRYSIEELRTIRRRRIEDWEKEGIFHNYSQPVVYLNTTIPLPSSRYPNHITVVLVLSTRSNHLHREAIRETWGKNHTVLFVIGGVERNESSVVQEQLVTEAKLYGDILDSIHPESYISLPYKLHFGYRWVVENMKQVKWIVKADDDTVVRVGTLQQVLLDLYNPEMPIVMGRIVPHSTVSRKGKWAEFQYERDIYPYWPQGSRGHVVSRPVASYIASQHHLTYYQGEDTSLGIWLNESPLKVWWIHSPFFQNHGQCQDEESLIIGHKLTPDDIRNCYEKLDEWSSRRLNDRDGRLLFLESRKQRKDAAVTSMQSQMNPGGQFHVPEFVIHERNHNRQRPV